MTQEAARVLEQAALLMKTEEKYFLGAANLYEAVFNLKKRSECQLNAAEILLNKGLR